MPSVSKSQQRLMGVAYAVKSGSMELKDVDSEYRDKVASLVDGMTKKDLKKYASTKHDKLPETVDEAFIGPFVFNDKMSSEELMGMYKGALDGYANYAKGMYYAKSDYKRAYQEIEKILKKRGVAVDETIQQTAITPGMIGGMGNVSLPSNGELGSGDFPHTLVQVADIDDDEEKKKQKGTVKNLQAEDLALTFKAFLNEQNEAMDYNDPVLIRLRQAELRRADMAKLDAIKKEAEKNRKKAMRRWNTRSYEKWLEEVASGGGAENAFDMARNAEFEPGLVDWVKKEFPGDDPMQRLQWDIEAFAESVVTEKFVKEFDKAVLDAETEAEVLKVYPDAEFYVGKSSHFFGQLEKNLFFKAYYAKYYQEDYGKKIKGDFKITTVYSEKGSRYVNLYLEESVVNEKKLKFKVGDFIKQKKGGNLGYEIKSIDPKFDAVEVYLDVTGQSTKYTFKHINKEWELAESVVNEKKLDRDDMMKFVEKYMDFVRTSEDFNGSEGGIWVSGENMDEFKGQVIYDYYAEGRGYELGVNVKWEKELNKRGWYSEWYDAGTVQIWPI